MAIEHLIEELKFCALKAQKYPIEEYFRTPWYKRVDLGFSYIFLQNNRDRMQDKWKFLNNFNIMGLVTIIWLTIMFALRYMPVLS